MLTHTGPLDELYTYRDRLLVYCAAVVDDLQAVVVSIPSGGWHTAVLPDGSTPHQILAHLRAVEQYALEPCIRRMAGLDPAHDPGKPFTDFDVRQWMSQSYNPAEPPGEIFKGYARARQAEMDALQRMSPEAWNQLARHPKHGLRTLQWWVERSLAHSRHHLRQLKNGNSDR